MEDYVSIATYLFAKGYTDKQVSALKEVVRYVGVTTTELTDGSTTNPITINGESYTANEGDSVYYNGVSFTWNGTMWQETVSFAKIITDVEVLQEQMAAAGLTVMEGVVEFVKEDE